VDSDLEEGLCACLCMHVNVCTCACVCVWGMPTLRSMWDLTAEPQDLPGAKETRNQGCGTWNRGLGRRAPSSLLRLGEERGQAGLGAWLEGRLWPDPPHV